MKSVPHTNSINPEVAEHILPIYQELPKNDLLERCLGGHTQNANESFNSTLWRLTPKPLHAGSKIVKILAYIAAGIFNEGHAFLLHLMDDLGIEISLSLSRYAKRADNDRTVKVFSV